MDLIQIELNFNGVNTTVQTGKDEKLKDIFKNFRFKTKAEDKALIFMYNGNIIQNDELTFNEVANLEDKKRNKMNLLVVEAEFTTQFQTEEIIIKANNIICPKCNEDIKLNIKDYTINLFECKNKHDIDNIFLDEFSQTQNINITKIECEICRKYNLGNVYNNKFYRCNSCKKNICPICISSHDKEHNTVNYEEKNFICEKHNKKLYIAYCEICKENIYMLCGTEHKGHKTIHYGDLLPDEKK